MFRLLAAAALLTAIAVGIADYLHAGTIGAEMFRSAADWWDRMAPGSRPALRDAMEQSGVAGIWDPLIAPVLNLPASLTLAGLSLALFFLAGLFRRR